jgi:protein gp37
LTLSTGIEWTDSTWNPVRGCSRVSEGCRNCYAEIMAARFSKPGQWGHGFAKLTAGDHRWTGRAALIESQLDLPLRWKNPRRIFVNSTSDLFHESLSFEDIAAVFHIMTGEAGAEAPPSHVYQILTKRPAQAKNFFRWMTNLSASDEAWLFALGELYRNGGHPRIWIGVSVEDQAAADERIPLLLELPVSHRFLSCEPLLGPILIPAIENIDWIICGGESGRGARPMHPDWARSLRDHAIAAGVPFFFKQHGEWLHESQVEPERRSDFEFDGQARGGFVRLGKTRAGRSLDGQEWNAIPP